MRPAACRPPAGCRCRDVIWQLLSHAKKVLNNTYSYPLSTEALLAPTFLWDWKRPKLPFNFPEVTQYLQEG